MPCSTQRLARAAEYAGRPPGTHGVAGMREEAITIAGGCQLGGEACENTSVFTVVGNLLRCLRFS